MMNEVIKDFHYKYTEKDQVSDKGAAISPLTMIEVVNRLVALPLGSRVADLGSGFSSVVLRYFQKEHDPSMILYSVDTDFKWLSKTRKFLSSYDLQVTNMMTWKTFLKKVDKPLDLIIFDLGYTRDRGRYLRQIMRNLKQSTLLFCDDMHKKAHGANVLAILDSEFKYDWISLKKETTDWIGRWCSLATNFRRK